MKESRRKGTLKVSGHASQPHGGSPPIDIVHVRALRPYTSLFCRSPIPQISLIGHDSRNIHPGMQAGEQCCTPDVPEYRTSIIFDAVQSVGIVWTYGSPPSRGHLLAYHCHGEVLGIWERKARRSVLDMANSICMTPLTPTDVAR